MAGEVTVPVLACRDLEVRGFSVVDPGGNWLRISKLGDTEDEAKREKTTGLARAIDHAARLGDAKGDHSAALETINRGLARFVDAPPSERVRALLYKAELAVREGDRNIALAALDESRTVALTDDERAALENDFVHVDELIGGPVDGNN